MDKSSVIRKILVTLIVVMAPVVAQEEGDTFGNWGIETQYISGTVHPGDDFYHYVNEGWLATAALPQGMPRYNAFLQVHLQTEDQLQAIMTDLGRGVVPPAPGGDQIINLYRSFMDQARIESLGLSPLKADLEKILALDSKKAIARWMARPGVRSVIALGVELHPKHPKRYTVFVSQTGLTLPDRTYYLDDQAPYPAIRRDYRGYIAATFERAGIAAGQQKAEALLAFETALAQIHWPPAKRRDRIANYHPMSREQLLKYAPGFPWNDFLQSFGIEGQDEFIVETDTAVKATAALVAATPVNVLQDYLAFRLVSDHASMLSEEFDEAAFRFFGTRLEGIEQQRERSLRALNFTNGNLGEVLGRVYVSRYFPQNRKAEMETYIPHVREAFRSRLQRSSWMDEPTQTQALAKLESFVAKIGYPDQWRDYSDIVIKADDLIGNVRRIRQWHKQESLSKIGKPRRDWEWGMNPQRVNAYYSYMRNEIVFPAAILQPPFFHPGGDRAVNFGAIGAVIGHEMGHGFDDQGSRSDENGVLRDWWTQAAREKFDAMGDQLVTQYNAYQPLPDMHINGRLSLGENIGDLGGLAIAHAAYRNYVEEKLGGKDVVLDGFTGDQRFFMSWAQVWREIHTEDFLRKKLLTGPHSPNKYRVNGIVRNMDAWYKAFEVTADNTLYLPPDERLRIW